MAPVMLNDKDAAIKPGENKFRKSKVCDYFISSFNSIKILEITKSFKTACETAKGFDVKYRMLLQTVLHARGWYCTLYQRRCTLAECEWSLRNCKSSL